MAVEVGRPVLPDNYVGSITHSRRWLFVSEDNCYQYMFGDFINGILNHMETHLAPNNVNSERVFYGIIWIYTWHLMLPIPYIIAQLTINLVLLIVGYIDLD